MSRIIEFVEEEAISKAMDVFWKKGYNGTSMRDLTAAMGINPSSLYRTIGDKHALFVKCIKSYTESRMQEARKFAAGQASPLTALIAFIDMSAEVIASDRDSCLAIKTTFEIAADNADVQKVLKADNDFTYKFLLNLLNEAIARKEIPAETEAETMTDHIMSAFTGWHESYILHQDKKRIRKMADLLIKQLK
jgi:TetR/AcrR family transcriptional regulator, transcriptional repressor for nem operon